MEVRLDRRWAVVAVAGASLACSGLLDDTGGAYSEQAELDAQDPVEAARLRGDFAGAEAMLRERLNADPSDARSWRLFGDLCFSRGKRYHQRWKENLEWAREHYTRSLTVDPTSCQVWGRLATVTLAASENDAIRAPREELDALPLDQGWEHCPGASLLQLEMLRDPTDDEWTAARRELGPRSTRYEQHAIAAPWQVDAVGRVDLSGLTWQPVLAYPEPTAGGAFVVLDLPVRASGVNGAKPRSFTYPEWLTIRRVLAERFQYLDKRFPERIPSRGRTRAGACPGTEFSLEGPDNFPVGTCAPGPQDRWASPVYDPAVLRPAGMAHFHHPSIAKAELPWSGIAEDSVVCLGGPVGRMFVDEPSCQVSYDKAIPQQRTIPADVGLMASSAEHAQQMVDNARSIPLLGPDIADHLARGDAAVGLPYAMLARMQPDLTGCKGRGIYTKAEFDEGAVTFTCVLGAWTYEFRELTVVDMEMTTAP